MPGSIILNKSFYLKSLCPLPGLRRDFLFKIMIKCKICGCLFDEKSNKIYCSKKCSNRAYTISIRKGSLKPKKCRNCANVFKPYQSLQVFCSYECSMEHRRKKRNYNWKDESRAKRTGKNNPAYRNGTRTNGKSYSAKHLRVCGKYRKKFLEKYGYLFCEKCKISNAIRYETHHIVYASEKPMHKELHNDRNLILLCIGCHNEMHGAKKMRNDLVEKRNLNELFECELRR